MKQTLEMLKLDTELIMESQTVNGECPNPLGQLKLTPQSGTIESHVLGRNSTQERLKLMSEMDSMENELIDGMVGCSSSQEQIKLMDEMDNMKSHLKDNSSCERFDHSTNKMNTVESDLSAEGSLSLEEKPSPGSKKSACDIHLTNGTSVQERPKLVNKTSAMGDQLINRVGSNLCDRIEPGNNENTMESHLTESNFLNSQQRCEHLNESNIAESELVDHATSSAQERLVVRETNAKEHHLVEDNGQTLGWTSLRTKGSGATGEREASSRETRQDLDGMSNMESQLEAEAAGDQAKQSHGATGGDGEGNRLEVSSPSMSLSENRSQAALSSPDGSTPAMALTRQIKSEPFDPDEDWDRCGNKQDMDSEADERDTDGDSHSTPSSSAEIKSEPCDSDEDRLTNKRLRMIKKKLRISDETDDTKDMPPPQTKVSALIGEIVEELKERRQRMTCFQEGEGAGGDSKEVATVLDFRKCIRRHLLHILWDLTGWPKASNPAREVAVEVCGSAHSSMVIVKKECFVRCSRKLFYPNLAICPWCSHTFHDMGDVAHHFCSSKQESLDAGRHGNISDVLLAMDETTSKGNGEEEDVEIMRDISEDPELQAPWTIMRGKKNRRYGNEITEIVCLEEAEEQATTLLKDPLINDPQETLPSNRSTVKPTSHARKKLKNRKKHSKTKDKKKKKRLSGMMKKNVKRLTEEVIDKYMKKGKKRKKKKANRQLHSITLEANDEDNLGHKVKVEPQEDDLKLPASSTYPGSAYPVGIIPTSLAVANWSLSPRTDAIEGALPQAPQVDGDERFTQHSRGEVWDCYNGDAPFDNAPTLGCPVEPPSSSVSSTLSCGSSDKEDKVMSHHQFSLSNVKTEPMDVT